MADSLSHVYRGDLVYTTAIDECLFVTDGVIGVDENGKVSKR